MRRVQASARSFCGRRRPFRRRRRSRRSAGRQPAQGATSSALPLRAPARRSPLGCRRLRTCARSWPPASPTVRLDGRVTFSMDDLLVARRLCRAKAAAVGTANRGRGLFTPAQLLTLLWCTHRSARPCGSTALAQLLRELPKLLVTLTMPRRHRASSADAGADAGAGDAESRHEWFCSHPQTR